jgi:DNA replication protein DnaC
MNIPLNQIFYGPPGTGKTYIMSSKCEEIIQSNFKQNNIGSIEDDFNRIVTFLRANFNEKDGENFPIRGSVVLMNEIYFQTKI